MNVYLIKNNSLRNNGEKFQLPTINTFGIGIQSL